MKNKKKKQKNKRTNQKESNRVGLGLSQNSQERELESDLHVQPKIFFLSFYKGLMASYSSFLIYFFLNMVVNVIMTIDINKEVQRIILILKPLYFWNQNNTSF